MISSSAVTVELFGPPEIRRDGAAVPVDTRKAIAVVAYLAVSGQPVSRDVLCATLWPESPQSRARGALRRTLSTVRSVIGGAAVVADRETVALDVSDLDIDVLRFGAAAARDDVVGLREAVGLYRGDFLSGFTIRKCPEFEDWHRQEADGFRRTADEVLRRAAEDATESGDPGSAVEYSVRRVEIDPLSEPAHTALMVAEAQAGSRSRAIGRYREMVRVLEEELGVAPLDGTKAVYEAIRRGDFERKATPFPAATTAPAPEQVSAREPPLVGRTGELGVLVDTYLSAAGSGRLLAIAGEAGIGKSALASAVITRAEQAGGVVASVRCHEGERDLPYAPLAALFRDLIEVSSVEDLAPAALEAVGSLVPELSSRVGDVAGLPAGPEARTRFLEALRTALVTLAGSGAGPGLVVLDDLHLADAATVEFVAYTARRLAASRMALLITSRTGQIGAADRIRKLVGRRADDDSVVEVRLERLSDDEVSQIVTAMAPTELGPEPLSRVLAASEGVPFFAVEYVRAMVDGRSLDEAPAAVADLVEGRLDALDGVGSQVAAAAAVIGRRFDAELVRGVSGRSLEEIATALDELTGRGLVTAASEEGSATYDFTHDKLREVAYARIGQARRRLLHQRAAHLLRSTARTSAAGLAEAAHHLTLAGDAADGAKLHADAGEAAAAIYANRDALRHFEAALTLGFDDVSRLREMMGDLRVRLGEYGAAREEYEAAAAFAGPDSMPRLEHKLGRLHSRAGDWETARNHFEEALDGTDDPVERTSVLSDLAANFYRAGNLFDAQSAAGQAAAAAADAGDEAATMKATNVGGLLALAAGEFLEATAAFEMVVELAGASGDVELEITGLNNLALGRGRSGDHAGALELFGRALELCRKVGDRHHEAALLSNRGDALFGLGKVDEAMESVKASARIMTEVGSDAEDLVPEIWKLTEW